MRARRWSGRTFLATWFLAGAALAQGAWVGYDVDIPSPEATGCGRDSRRAHLVGRHQPLSGRRAGGGLRARRRVDRNLAQQIPQAAGVVIVCFLFPGGVDLASGRSSDGVYDFRGPASIAAGARRTPRREGYASA